MEGGRKEGEERGGGKRGRKEEKDLGKMKRGASRQQKQKGAQFGRRVSFVSVVRNDNGS